MPFALFPFLSMVIPKFNSFRRYTPPTCTLEIYHPQPFWGRWQNRSFPPLFSFQLHFDDPRITQEDKISIIGDRDLLETLRIKVEEYISRYLQQNQIEQDNLTSDLSPPPEKEVVYLTRQSDYNHLLYYQSFEPHQETIEITLNNTQLLDLTNALTSYYWDATAKVVKPPKKKNNFAKAIALTALVATFGSFWWWSNQQNTIGDLADGDSQVDEDKFENNVTPVVPPTPLDPKSIPQTIVPKVPEKLLQQEKLLPPIPTLTQPPAQLVLPSTPPAFTPENETAITTIIPTPTTDSSNQSDSSINVSRQNSPDGNQNQLNIDTGLVTALNLGSENSQTNPTNQNTQTNQINQINTNNPVENNNLNPTSVPTLTAGNNNSPSSQQTNINTNPDQKVLALNNFQDPFGDRTPVEKPSVTLKEKINSDNSDLIAKRIYQDASSEVKSYFNQRWTPAEQLTQSIEYRLQISPNGTLVKVTPVGQIAEIYLDKTAMPVLGETIVANADLSSPVTVRLILTPNGDVKAFPENNS